MGRLERIKAIFSGFNDLGQCAISWLLHQKEVTSVILGPRTIEQLLNNAGAIEIRMEIDVLKALDEFRPVREWGVPPLRNC